MGFKIIMPKLTHDMNSAVLLTWYKHEGDTVKKGEPLLSVETDKAAVDIEAEETGVLSGLRYTEGADIPVGEIIAEIIGENEKSSPEIPDNRKPAPSHPTPREAGRTPISPLAKKTAEQYSIDITKVHGTGPDGRIVVQDIRTFLDERKIKNTAESAAESEALYTIVPLTKTREKIAARMLDSVHNIPRFDVEIETDMTACGILRDDIHGQSGTAVSYTAILIKCTAAVLKEYGNLNARYVQNEYRVYQQVKLGIAFAAEAGVIVPVIKQPEAFTLLQLQKKLSDLKEKIRKKNLAPDDLGEGTFTLSNLGMYGIDSFRAIINPPEVAILSVGGIRERPVIMEGSVSARPIMRMNLSVDHRIIDGAHAAQFIVSLKEMIETVRADS